MDANQAPPTDRGSLDGGFRKLFEQECSYVFHSLRRLGVPVSDTPDLVHEVFIVAHRLLPTCDQSRPMRPWLFSIAFRVASDYRRMARVRRETLSEPAELADTALCADELLARRQRQRWLLEALESVELGQRAVLVMHDIDGLPMPQIAGALEIPLNTAYSRLRLARSELSVALHRIQAKRGAA